MSLRKTYRSLVYKDLDTYVMVNGQKVLIQFRGGSLQPAINGIFATSDPDLIRALDKDRGNGTSFKCIHVDGKEEPEPRKPETQKTKEPENKGDDEDQDKDSELKEVPGISTLQDARNYLLANVEGLKPSQVNNTGQVRACAAKNGITFPDLP